MEKNYYEILEVDRNASYDIIRKAYNTLAKKYHPDLHSEDEKNIVEEKLKLINEAYEVIGKESTRKQYDISLNQNFVPIEMYNNIYLENQHLRNKLKNLENQITTQSNYEKRTIHAPSYTNQNNNQDNQNNNSYLKNKFSDSFKNLFALFLTILILFLLWNIPFIKDIIKNILFK